MTDHSDLRRWAADAWVAMAAMLHPATGLPADHIGRSVRRPVLSSMTSPTNIGGYLWSTVAVRELGLISPAECTRRLTRTVAAVSGLRRHAASGMFYNWYDEATGQRLDVFPDTAEKIEQFLSSVDNGWLAAGLMVAAAADPQLAVPASEVLQGMDFASFYDPEAPQGSGGGLLRGGFWDERPAAVHTAGERGSGGPEVFFTGHHYSLLNSEPRIAGYLGIIRGQIPPEHLFAMEREPVDYRGLRIVPTWGGSMFEALMPDLLVPEAAWAPAFFGINHPRTVRAQREFGLLDAGYGYWGFSPASRPGGGYSEWGAAPIGAGAGYPSDLARTVEADVRAGRATYGDGVITPHALFLALPYEPRTVVDCLRRLESDFLAYGAGGFYDAVAVGSGAVADRYLALDQAMILGAVGNHLSDNAVRRYFCAGEVESALRPLLVELRFDTGGTG